MGGWSISLRKSGMGVTGCTVSPRRWQIPCSLAPRLRLVMTSAPGVRLSNIQNRIRFRCRWCCLLLKLSLLHVFWMKKNRESIVLTPIQLVICNLQKHLHKNKEQELSMNWLNIYLYISNLMCIVFQMDQVWKYHPRDTINNAMNAGW